MTSSAGGSRDKEHFPGYPLHVSFPVWTAGAIMWELGGKQSTFKLKPAPGQVLDSAGEIFAYQHDPEATGNDEYTVFDDESGGGGGLLPYSRVVTVVAKVATLVKSVEQPEGLVAGAKGNAQTTRNGDLFVGWGALPCISEFSPSGQLLLNAELPAGLPPTAPTACRGIRPVSTPTGLRDLRCRGTGRGTATT